MNFFEKITKYRLVSIQVASYHFSPTIFITIITCLLLYLLVSLGFWQLDRAQYKENLKSTITQRKNLVPVPLNSLPQPSVQRRYRPATIMGQYDTKHHILLDNKTFNGRVGYHVFTPFKVSATKSILVNRGFVAQGKTRQQLPKIKTPKEQIKIQGLIDLMPAKGFLLADNIQELSSWPVVLQYIDKKEIEQLLNVELYDMMIWLDPKSKASLSYDLPALNLNTAKNQGYAFQWFAMSLAVFVLYIAINLKRNNIKKPF